MEERSGKFSEEKVKEMYGRKKIRKGREKKLGKFSEEKV